MTPQEETVIREAREIPGCHQTQKNPVLGCWLARRGEVVRFHVIDLDRRNRITLDEQLSVATAARSARPGLSKM